jgi:hypothetical protein
MMPIRRALAGFLALCLLAITWSAAHAQAQTTEYFPQTGHNLSGEFLAFYHAVADPTTLYGYPITEAFKTHDGLLVQYFQRARFELHPENAAAGRVVLTDIGRQLYAPSAQLATVNPLACRFYAQSGFSVCYAFLDFYDQFGGPAQFGYPISPFEYQDGLIVQYFERARLEWQPSNPQGERVVLTDLGTLYFDKMHEDPGLKLAAQPLNAGIAAPVSALQVRAFVWKVVTAASDSDSIYVIVTDQRGQAVDRAVCTALIQWPDGTAQSTGVLTDSAGIGTINLSFQNKAPGNLVPIAVDCNYNSAQGGAVTSFRIWY